MNKPQTIPDLFQQNRSDWLLKAQHIAEAKAQVNGMVTILDVLKEHPLPNYLATKNKAILGQVFKNPVFKRVGVVRSTATASHGHYITQWRLDSAYYPERELVYRKHSRDEDGRSD
jgi:hypothetical protein